MPCLLLYFSMGYVSVPQTKEQAEASASLPPGACNGLTGSHCRALIWGHGGCCHGDRWQSGWKVGWWQLMLVNVCFVLLCFMVDCTFLATSTRHVETWSGTSQNGALLLHHKIENTTKPPQSNDMHFIVLVGEIGTCLTILAESCFGCLLMEQKLYSEERDLARCST